MKRTTKIGAITLILACSTIAFSDNMLYWSNWVDETIRRAQIDGTDMQVIYDGFDSGRGIAIDPNTSYMYWANFESNGSEDDTVFYKARLNGTEQTELFRLTNEKHQSDIAFDAAHQTIYWIERASPNYHIMRANLDGSNMEIVLSDGYFKHDLELDIENNYIYWSTWSDNSKIWRANLDGTNITEIFICSANYDPAINHITLSPEKDYLYATVETYHSYLYTYNTIYKIDLSDLSNTKISESFPEEVRFDHLFKGITVDSESHRIYFNVTTRDQQGPAAIYSCNPDGSDFQEVISGLAGEPWTLLIVPGPDCIHPPTSDLDGDCKVNLTDLAILTLEWLDCGLSPDYECQ